MLEEDKDDKEENKDETSEENGDKEAKDANTSREDNSGPMAVSRDLAKALVQIEKGIEHRFLLPPFGKTA